jgi:hypothetical protein
MSKASAPSRIEKQITRIIDSPFLDPKIRLFKAANGSIQFRNNPNFDPNIRFFVAKDKPNFSVRGGSLNKVKRVTSQDKVQAAFERFTLEKAPTNPETSGHSIKEVNRDPLRNKTQAPRADFAQTYPDPKRGIGRREQALQNNGTLNTAKMSSQLTTVLTKDACPRK